MGLNMNGNYESVLRDCEIELNSIKCWIEGHRLDSNVRFLTLYAVIKASGTVEYVFKQMIYDYLENGANNEAKLFLSKSTLDASYNPTPGQMYKVLEKMNPDWRVTFEDVIKGSTQKGQLNSLVDLRNSFAHGASITASISDVKDYFDAGKWILEELYKVIYPST